MKSAREDGIITDGFISSVHKIYDMNRRNKYLSNVKIYHGADGRWFTRVPIIKNGVLIEKKRQKAFHTREEAEDYIVMIYKMLEENPTVEDIFKRVTDEKFEADEIVASTYMRNWNDFRRFFYDFGDRRISTIDEFDVEDFIYEQKRKHKLTAKGYANLTCCLRSIFRYARRKKMVSFSIDEVIKNIDFGKKSFRVIECDEFDEVFTDEEVELLADYFKSKSDVYSLGLLLIFGTGLRIGELVSLNWNDYNGRTLMISKTETTYKDDEGKFKCEIKDRPKTRAGRRKVPVPSSMTWIFDRLKELSPETEFIFATYSSKERKMVRCRTDYFRKAMRSACKKIGIPHRPPHKIRKTYASILLDNSIGEKTITENMGHTDIKTTRRSYGRQRMSEEQRIQIVDSIEEFQICSSL